ncbi:MAG TPA: hypothetical protein VF338_00625, partial [Leptolinea sp.]
SREFSLKGFVLGAVVMLPFLFSKFNATTGAYWQGVLGILALLLVFPAVTAFISLNFTGSTPFTSKTGVRLEMNRYIPIMAWSFGIGIIITIVLRVLNLTGVA